MMNIKKLAMGAIVASSTITLGMNKLTNKIEKYKNEESKCTCVPVKKNTSSAKITIKKKQRSRLKRLIKK